ncbi:MAG: PfkB family carbohydrate kinase [Candidatus Cyclobacteriaceae bacterium M2_1C_046]
MKKVITFGEIMLRLSTPGHARFTQSEVFNATYGGGEANVAVSLAQFGLKSAHVTRFPDNDLGKAATAFLRKFGVTTDNILYGGDRIGLYFLEMGCSVRPGRIIFDRADSSFATLDPQMFDWEGIFEGADWFHWTGITPAISLGAADCCRKAIEVARAKGLMISADINYRRNLWQYGKKASEVMPELIESCDIIVAGHEDAFNILNIKPNSGDYDPEISVSRQIMERFSGIKKIINTNRTSVSASHNKLMGLLYDGEKLIKTATYDINPIVDRIGGGDAFMAGFIYGQLMNMDDQKALNFAVAASVLKHTIEGDANLATVDEVEHILSGEISGRLIR